MRRELRSSRQDIESPEEMGLGAPTDKRRPALRSVNGSQAALEVDGAGPSVAICHEWLAERYGSEKTFEAMAEALPGADLYALTMDRSVPYSFSGRPVRTTAVDRVALLRRRRDLQLPLMPLAWRYSSRRSYDVVVTSSHACVKGFWPGRSALHLCYTHTPMRYVWSPTVDQRNGRGVAARVGEGLLRSWDRRASHWVDEFAANSRDVADRIMRFYGRPATVIAPPIDTEFFTPPPAPRADGFALAVSRMVTYKRLDLAVRACALAGYPLVVAGSGPDEARLRGLARRLKADVEFAISPDDHTLRSLYRAASMLVFPAEEDFGLVAVEAQACGTPVVGLGRGGCLDTVVDGRTGVLVAGHDERLFAEAIERAQASPLDAGACRLNAERFSVERFREQFREWVSSAAARRGLDVSLRAPS